MLNAALALAAYLVVVWLPGALICDMVRRDGGWLRNVALGAVVGVGVEMIVAEGLQAIGGPIRPWSVLPVAAIAPVAAWTWLALRHRRAVATNRSRPSLGGQAMVVGRTDAALLLIAGAIGLMIWCLSIRSPGAVVPNTDGTHHALYAERILRSGSLDNERILASDLVSRTPAGSYYPLALHVVAALLAALTGSPVSTVLTVSYVLAAAVVLPIGTFALTRRLCPQLPLAAGVAAILSVSFPWFPYGPIIWGGIPTIIAMSQVPAVVDALVRRAVDGRTVPTGIVTAVAGYAMFQEHNPELITSGLFAFLIGATTVRAMAPVHRRRLLRGWATTACVVLALVAPLTGRLVSGANARSAVLGNAGTSSIKGVGRATSLLPDSGSLVANLIFSPMVLLFALIGFVVAVPRRWCRGLGWCVAAAIALFAGTLTKIPVLTTFTLPWYRAALRVSYLFSYGEVIYGAVGMVVVGAGAVAFASRIRWGHARRLTTALVSVAAIAVAATEIPWAAYLVDRAYRHSSLIGPDQRSAFSWLGRHVPPGQRVLNQFSDGSGWMDVLDTVTPLFATTPDDGNDPAALWGERLYLLNHAGNLATDRRAQRAAKVWHVTYAYVNGRIFDGNQAPRLTDRKLAASPAYRRVWRQGSVSIFEIVVD
jgi:hypothetical protein